jgi:hypothetical protein
VNVPVEERQPLDPSVSHENVGANWINSAEREWLTRGQDTHPIDFLEKPISRLAIDGRTCSMKTLLPILLNYTANPTLQVPIQPRRCHQSVWKSKSAHTCGG